MRLYHGTDKFFEFPDLSKCRPFKDFGKGFYLSPDLAVAKRMAERCAMRSEQANAPMYVYVYDFDESGASGLAVRTFPSIINSEFALFVLANRRGRINAADHNRDNRYDIVSGPIADDKLGVLFRRFEDGEVSIEYLTENLKYRKLSLQYSFHTKRSLKLLSLLEVRRV